MFTITKLAASATKMERRTINTFAKIAKSQNLEFKPMLDSFNRLIENNEQLQYSKNIFKKCLIWVKTFFKNYRKVKNYVSEKLNIIKENYGELFTKKRAKKVRNSLFKSAKNEIKTGFRELKENSNGLFEDFKKIINRGRTIEL